MPGTTPFASLSNRVLRFVDRAVWLDRAGALAVRVGWVLLFELVNVLAWILGIALAVVFSTAGVTKLLDFDRMREHFGYTAMQYRVIGSLEILGVVGVVLGLVNRSLEFIGAAAAAGLMAIMLGALLTHARVEDPGKKVIPALVMFVVAAVFLAALTLR